MTLPFNLGDREGLARKLVSATLGSAGVRLAGMTMTFLVGVQLARYLGPEGYGIYASVMALVAILIVPAQMGLPQLATRELSSAMALQSYPNAKGVIFWFVLMVVLASLVMVMLGFLGLTVWGDIDAKTERAYWWGLAVIPILACTNLGISILRGFHRVVTAQTHDALVRPALFAAFLLIGSVWADQFDASTAMALQLVTATVALGLLIVGLYRLVPIEVRHSKMLPVRPDWAASAIPMTGTEVLRAMESQYAVLILALLAAAYDIGIFRVALACAALVALPASMINVVVMSYAAQLHAQGDQARLQLIATGSAFAMLASTIAICGVLVMFGEPLIVLAFGAAFEAAWAPLVLMGVAFSVNAFFGSGAMILNMCGQEKAVAVAHAIALVTGMVLTAALFSRFGILAPALAMIVSESVKGAIMWRVAKRTIAVDTAATSVAGRFIWRAASPGYDGVGRPRDGNDSR